MKKRSKSKISCVSALFVLLIVQFISAQNSVIYDTSRTALVLIQTKQGPIKIRLYNQTPLHRDRFLELASAGFYDSLLFHRVIDGFMIQGGDPDSRHAKPGKLLGDGDIIKWSSFEIHSAFFPLAFVSLPYYDWIMPEFRKELFHKRGVLATARESDEKNPLKKSSGCQFYITQGRGPLGDRDLKLYEYRINKKLRSQLRDSLLELPQYATMKKNYASYKLARKNDSLNYADKILDSLIAPIYEKTPHYTFSEEQIKTYKTLGGTPHLDGNYTVYGEVIYGMDVVDKIAKEPTDKNDRPLEDIRMLITVLRRPK